MKHSPSNAEQNHAHDHSHEHAHSHEHHHEHAASHDVQAASSVSCCAGPGKATPVNLADLPASTETLLYLHIPQMDCPAEEQMLRSKLGKMASVQEMRFDLMQRRLEVEHQAGARQTVLDAVKALGFVAVQAGQQDQAIQADAGMPVWRMASSVALALLAEVADWMGAAQWLVILMAAVAIGLSGTIVYRKGFIALKNKQLNINALMSIAVTGAVLLRQWPEAAMVMSLFNLAEWLEARSLDRARQAVDGLMDLAPDQVQASTDGINWNSVSARQVEPGTWLRVAPGARLALDGVLPEGVALVSQAHITGESAAVEKQPGDVLYAGSVNGMTELRYRASAAFDQTLLARIARSVQQAQSNKAPVQRFVDQFALYYTPAVVVLALALAIGLPLLGNWSWQEAVYQALVLLVIACPCALVISTPVAVVSALAHAARVGILVKGGAYMEGARKLRFLGMDKTGTLTLGQPQEQQCLVLPQAIPFPQAERWARLLAQRSDHPASQALAKQAVALEPGEQLEQFEAIPGSGVQAMLQGRRIRLGKRSWVAELLPQPSPCLPEEEQAAAQGATLVYFGTDQGLCLLFTVMDSLRPEAGQVIARLRALGVEVTMLSGDHQAAVQYMAEQAGINDFRGGLLPEDKLAWVKQKSAQAPVAMLGDGINDAPALAQADIGIAMGALGSDMAIETADVALMDDDLRKLPALIEQSRKLHQVLVQNIGMALGIKAVFLVLAALGMASMWMAVFADVGASLLVIVNSLRLLNMGSRAQK